MAERRKVIALFALLIFILLVLPEIYIFPLFLLVIKPVGNKKIDEILAQVDAINDTYKKLERIAKLEVKDFKDIYKHPPDSALDLITYVLSMVCGSNYCRYPIYFDSGIRVRAADSPLSNDPYWIAFFKVGGCSELASLFNEIAKRAGLEVRVVETRGEDHAWVEVKINGKWVHVDPTLYYINYHFGSNIKWFDNPGFYELKWFRISKVFVKNTNEDITEKYTDIGALVVYLTKPADRIAVKTSKNGVEREAAVIGASSSVLNIKLGGKKYNVTAEKDLVPQLFVLQDTKNVEVIEGKQATIRLSPANLEIRPLFYLLMLLIVEIVLILFKNMRK